jgi:hypothetical protein
MLVRQARMLHQAGADTVVALVNSETAGLIAARAVRIPPWMKLEARDTPSSMESLFTLREYLCGAQRFLLATVDAVAEASELRRFAARALELTGGTGARFDGAIAALGARQCATVTAGFYYLPAAIFDLAGRARAERLDAMRKLLGMAIGSGMRLAAVELERTIDVDESADLMAARAMIAGADAGRSRG